jgi:hypothetical protein
MLIVLAAAAAAAGQLHNWGMCIQPHVEMRCVYWSLFAYVAFQLTAHC